jgi:exonuclease VII small subunit
MNQLVLFNTPLISVPKKVLYIDKKGKEKAINTLTPKGNISKREKKPAIKFENNDSNFVMLENKGVSKASRIESILDAKDQQLKKRRGQINDLGPIVEDLERKIRVLENMRPSYKRTEKLNTLNQSYNRVKPTLEKLISKRDMYKNAPKINFDE